MSKVLRAVINSIGIGDGIDAKEGTALLPIGLDIWSTSPLLSATLWMTAESTAGALPTT